MTKENLFDFLASHKLAVLSSLAADGTPQSAVVGIAVTRDLEVIFDTLSSSRKYRNLRANGACSVTVWSGEITAQYEGIAQPPTGSELARCREVYFAAWPDGRDRLSWPGLTHFVVRPKWIRYTNFEQRPPILEEFRLH